MDIRTHRWAAVSYAMVAAIWIGQAYVFARPICYVPAALYVFTVLRHARAARALSVKLPRATLLSVVLLVGCTEPAPRVYTCTVLYRCAGDPNVTARFGLPCASNEDDAADRMIDAAIVEVGGICDAWQYVRAECEPYEPETTCDLAR